MRRRWLDGKGEHYFHTFTNRNTSRPDTLINPWGKPYFPEFGAGLSPMHHWLTKKLRGESIDTFARECLPSTMVCEAKKAPRCPNRPELDRLAAYHFDAALVARYLSSVAQQRGVERVAGHVERVERAESGLIEAVSLRDGRRLEADLFIDCSGFRSLLLGQALEEPFVSDAKHLLVDAAVAIPCSHDPERDGLASYTTSTAHSAGWSWDIPLYHRNGTGYVYSSQFLDSEAAERELRTFLGSRSEGGSARHLKLRIGKMRNLWVENCIGMGLAGSFLEPLESTSIFMTEYQLAQLINLFPDKRFSKPRIRAYNLVTQEMYDDIRDFIVMHYVLSRRRDTPFWVEATRDEVMPDSLRTRLEFFRESVPVNERLPVALFKTLSFAQILAGMDHLPGFPTPLSAHFDERHGEAALQRLRAERDDAVAGLPDHYGYLKSLHQAAAARESVA